MAEKKKTTKKTTKTTKKTTTKATTTKKTKKEVVAELPVAVSQEEITTFVNQLVESSPDLKLKEFVEKVKEHFGDRELDTKAVTRLAGPLLHNKAKAKHLEHKNPTQISISSKSVTILTKEEILIVYNSLDDVNVKQMMVQGLACFGAYVITDAEGVATDVIKNTGIHALVQKALGPKTSEESGESDE